MSDLLPCPFCGDLMTTWLEESHAIHRDNRANCPLASLSLRIEVWNTRTAQAALIDADVKAERERCRKLAAARADYLEDAINNGGGSKTLIASKKGGMIELRQIAAAIRKGEQP